MLVVNPSKSNNKKSIDKRNTEEMRFLERENNSENHKEETYLDMRNRIINTETMSTNRSLEKK